MSLTPDIESIGYIVLVTSWVCPAIALPVFCLRIYSAVHIIKRWHWDDTLMVLAALFALGNSTVDSIQVKNGLGKHMVDVPPETLKTYFLISLVGATTTYNLAVMCTKCSILLYYLRFPASRAFRLVTIGVLIVSVGYTISGTLAFAYNCNPIEKAWDKSLETGTCIDVTTSLLVRAVFNVVTDVCILLLPIWLLWPLRLWSIWQRLSVLVVLMAGGFVVIASSLRLAAFWTDYGLTDSDHTWHYVKNSNWCLLETWAGVFCACLPSLKCFFVHHFPSMFTHNRNRMSRWNMVHIPVTADDSASSSEPCSTSAWRFVRIKKKASVGSSEPDLEADGRRDSGPSVGQADHVVMNEKDEKREQEMRDLEPEMRGPPRDLEKRGYMT